MPRRLGLFSIDRANLLGIRARDYGDGRTPPAVWIAKVLEDWRLPEANGEVLLMTFAPAVRLRVQPRQLLAVPRPRGASARRARPEVRNTFGERHCYLCFHEDRRPIAPDDEIAARKVFHVSPFMAMGGEYRFRFCVTPERVAVAINLLEGGETVLRTSVAGTLAPLGSARLLWAVLRNPLYPLKVIGLIHYQAVKLFLKGMRHFRDPPPAAISR